MKPKTKKDLKFIASSDLFLGAVALVLTKGRVNIWTFSLLCILGGVTIYSQRSEPAK